MIGSRYITGAYERRDGASYYGSYHFLRFVNRESRITKRESASKPLYAAHMLLYIILSCRFVVPHYKQEILECTHDLICVFIVVHLNCFHDHIDDQLLTVVKI